MDPTSCYTWDNNKTIPEIGSVEKPFSPTTQFKQSTVHIIYFKNRVQENVKTLPTCCKYTAD